MYVLLEIGTSMASWASGWQGLLDGAYMGIRKNRRHKQHFTRAPSYPARTSSASPSSSAKAGAQASRPPL